MKEKLQAILIKEIVAGLAHNINTPLNLILGYAQQMQTKGFNPDHLQKILDAGFKIDSILSGTQQGIMLSEDINLSEYDLVELLTKELVLLTDDLRIKRAIKFNTAKLVGSFPVKSIPAAMCLLFTSLIHQILEYAPVSLDLSQEALENILPWSSGLISRSRIRCQSYICRVIKRSVSI